MTWILLALVAHALNALVFVVDKGLLGKRESTVSRPAWYAAYSGLVAAGASVVLLYEFVAPTWLIVQWSLLAGLLWMVALCLFFVALKNGEPSRVVPVAGSSVPVFTLIFAALFLHERIPGVALIAVGLLVIGGALLSIQWRGPGVSARAGVAAVLSGAAFAGHFAVSKYVYSWAEPFLPLFAYVRLGVGVWALLLIVILLGQRRASGQRVRRTQIAGAAGGIALAFIASKVVGMVALLLQNYAIKLGSVTVVNALQGTQYLFVLVLATAVSAFAPRFFREEVSRVALAQKIMGIGCIIIGLIILVAV